MRTDQSEWIYHGAPRLNIGPAYIPKETFKNTTAVTCGWNVQHTSHLTQSLHCLARVLEGTLLPGSLAIQT